MVKPAKTIQSAWRMWYDVKPSSDDAKSGFYGDRLQEICDMGSIGDFPVYDEYMKNPASAPKNSNMYVFRGASRPMWERFCDGGSWSYKMKRGSSKLAHIWENLVRSCLDDGIGSDNVAGIVLGSRANQISINVWLVSGQTSQLRFEVLERLRGILKLEEGDEIQYKDFQSSIKDDSSRTNAITYRVNGEDPHASYHHKKYVLPDPLTGSFTFNYNS